MGVGFWTLVKQSESDPGPKRLCPVDGRTVSEPLPFKTTPGDRSVSGGAVRIEP